MAAARYGSIVHWLADGIAPPVSPAFTEATGWKPVIRTWRHGFASEVHDVRFVDPGALKRHRPRNCPVKG